MAYAELGGTVVGEVAGGVAGDRVAVVGVGLEAVVDEGGGFAIGDLPEGSYCLAHVRPFLLGLDREYVVAEASVVAGDTATVRIEAPSPHEVLAAACRVPSWNPEVAGSKRFRQGAGPPPNSVPYRSQARRPAGVAIPLPVSQRHPRRLNPYRRDGIMARDPRTPRRLGHMRRRHSATAITGSLGRLAAVAAAFATLPILSPPPSARAQDTARPSQVTITGTVVDAVTGQPISGVVVEVRGVGFRLQTDTDGGFTLSRIPVGDYQLELSHPGYHPAVGDFTVMRSGEFVTTMEPVFTGSDDLLTGIIGVVADGADGRPIGGVTVRSTNARRGMLTDSRGRFSLTELSPGLHVVEFVQLGYVSRRDSIRVIPGRVTDVRVSLSVDPVQMDPIEVSVERREIGLQEVGFYTRESEGFGDFIDREYIEQRAPAQVSDLFTTLPGVDTRPDPGNPFEKQIMLRGGRSENCFPRVIMDGVVVGRGGDEPAMLDRLLEPSAVAGVEVYATQSGVPAQYGGTGVSCGLIIIWTRR